MKKNLDRKKFTSEFNALRDKIITEGADFVSRRRLAYLALYLGETESAYKFSLNLGLYGNRKLQKSRLKTLELLLGKSKRKENSSQVSSGILTKFSDGDLRIKKSAVIKKIINENYEWSSHENVDLKISSFLSPRYIRENLVPLGFEPGVAIVSEEGDYSFGERIIGYWIYKGVLIIKENKFDVIFKIAEYPDQEKDIEIIASSLDVESINSHAGEVVVGYFLQNSDDDKKWLDIKLEMYQLFSRKPQQFQKDLSFYQAHEGWGLVGLRPTLLRLNNYKLDEWLNKNKEVLDIGCNIGCFGIEVSKKCKSYYGFDNNPDLVKVAKKLAAYKEVENCFFEEMNFFDFLSKNNKKFDVIFSFAVHGWIGMPMNNYIDILKGLVNKSGIVFLESHHMDSEEEKNKFAQSMKIFLEKGFTLLNTGEIMDDGIRNRAFYTFQLVQ